MSEHGRLSHTVIRSAAGRPVSPRVVPLSFGVTQARHSPLRQPVGTRIPTLLAASNSVVVPSTSIDRRVRAKVMT